MEAINYNFKKIDNINKDKDQTSQCFSLPEEIYMS